MRSTKSVFFLCGTIGCLFALPAISQSSPDESEIYDNLSLFADVFSAVQRNYVEEADVETLTKGALQGMLQSLDPHSVYLDAKALDDENVRTRGRFGGLGIEVTMEEGWVKVISPIDDTPAAEAGVQPGDFITELDGETVLGLTLEQAVDIMRGPVGSEIVLTIERTGEDEPLEITITRDIIKIAAAEVTRIGNALVVRIGTFSENALGNVAEGISEQAELAGGLDELSGIVIDLRNNPGGLLNSAVDISDAFLEQGEIVSVRGRNDEDTERYLAEPGDLAEGKPVVVLINGGSASASEIVAGALQDHGRAVVIGTKSFGKGSVQSLLQLGAGKGAIRLTTARYYTPSGRSIQAEGIQPDINIRNRVNSGEVEADRFRSESELRNALERDELIEAESGEEDSEALVLEIEEVRDTDFQLAYSLDVLNGLSAFSQSR